jgi:hypothetical protein
MGSVDDYCISKTTPAERLMALSLDEIRILTSSVWNRLLQESVALQDNHVPELPPVLFHYTNTYGLMGILGSGKIWATGMRHLNDTQELIHAESIACGVIDRLSASTSSYLVRHFLRYLKLYLQEYVEVDRFVASFCTDEDLLSQWHLYGHGVGYALGFDPDDNLPAMAAVKHARLVKVVYDEKTQIETIETHICKYLGELQALGLSDDWVEPSDLAILQDSKRLRHIELDFDGLSEGAKWLNGFLATMLVCLRDDLQGEFTRFKHPGFAQEREWRLVYNSEPENSYPMKFRVVNNVMIPYVELPLLWGESINDEGGFYLKRVVIGPCNNHGAVLHSTRLWLKHNYVPMHPEYSRDVVSSMTPFRTW